MKVECTAFVHVCSEKCLGEKDIFNMPRGRLPSCGNIYCQWSYQTFYTSPALTFSLQ
jgi:hypothetical protein